MSTGDTPLLIHLHIPKNAGTTLSRLIKLRLLLRPPTNVIHHARILGYYNVRGWENRIMRIQSLPPKAQAGVRFFESHAGYGVHELLPKPNAYITMLRDPVDRTLSTYYFLRAKGRLPDGQPLDEFVRATPFKMFFVDNAQVRFLAGEKGHFRELPVGAVPRELLELAKARIAEPNFLLCGLTEMFDESAILLRRRLGWQDASYGRSNITKERKKKDELPRSTVDLIREMNALDIELHAHARRLLTEQIAAEGESFQAELAALREHNERHAGRLGSRYSRLRSVRHTLQKLRLVPSGKGNR